MRKPNRRSFKALMRELEKSFPGINDKLRYHMYGPNNVNGLGQGEGAFDFVGPPAPDNYGETTAWYDKAFDFLSKSVPAYFAYETQKDVASIQIERAKQGLPPIDMTKYGAAPVTVRHQVDPATFQQALSPETKQMLWVGASIIGAIFLLPKLTS